MTKTATAAEFSASDFDALDEARMTVMMRGKPTTWVWTFAGPGHPRTIEQTSRMARERLQEQRLKEQAQVNGKKWKAADESEDEVRARNIRWVVERLLGWSPVVIDGAELPFSQEAAEQLLKDPRKVALFSQAVEFLSADDSFTQRSATN